MNTNITTTSKNNVRKKSIFKSPDKMLAYLGIGAAGFGALYKLMPMILTLCTNIFNTIIVIIGIIASLLVVAPILKNFKLIYFQLCRKIMGIFVEMDPIAILKRSIKKMKDKLIEIAELRANLEKSLKKLDKAIEDYKEQLKNSIDEYKVVEEKVRLGFDKNTGKKYDEDTIIYLKGRKDNLNNKITLLGNNIDKAQERRKNHKNFIRIIKIVSIKATNKVEDAETKVKLIQEEYESAKAYSSISKAFNSIFNSSWLARSEEEEMAIEVINDTINQGLADMELMLSDSGETLIDYEINSEKNDSKVQSIINAYNNGKFNLDYSEESKEVPDYIEDSVEVPYAEYIEAKPIANKQQKTLHINNYFK